MDTRQTNRRQWLSICGTTGILGIAGCLGDADDDPVDDDDDTDDPVDDADTDDDDDGVPVEHGTVDVTVEPSAEALTYGEEYTVSVTIQNPGDEDVFHPGSFVAHAGAQTWTTLTHVEAVQIPAGDELTETHTLVPPTLGDVEFGYMDTNTQVVLEQWNLSVGTPQVAFGETNRFYDGLAVTADLDLADEMEMPVRVTAGEDPGTRSLSPPAGTQWVIANLRLENTSETDTVRFERVGQRSRFFLTANDVQQQQYDTQIWWSDPGFEDQLSIHEYADVAGMSGYFDPPSELTPGGVAEGWLLFTAPEDVTVQTLQLSLTRFEETAWDDVRANWEGA